MILKIPLKGPIIIGGKKSSNTVYQQRIVVIQNYVKGQTITLNARFPGNVEKIFFAGNCLLVWSEPAHLNRIISHRWQTMSCVTIWSRKTGAFLRVLNRGFNLRAHKKEMRFIFPTDTLNISCSVMNAVAIKGCRNIWMSLLVTPYRLISRPSGPKRLRNHLKSGKMTISNG